MPRIILHATSFDAYWAHYSLINDNYFFKAFYENGYELVKSNEVNLNDDDFVLFLEAKSLNYLPYLISHCGLFNGLKLIIRNFAKKLKRNDVHNADLYQECRSRGMLNKTLLLILEGKIDAPENHSSNLKQLCNYIFTWNDDLIDGKTFIKINWPQPIFWPEVNPLEFSKKKLLTNISANKFSSNNLELYSLRRKSIKYFENRLGDQFDLYGIGWNKPVTFKQRMFGDSEIEFNSYRGEVQSKSATFSKYRFALIYENAQVSGWITEKIFDCIRSMCVPIYLGAPNIDKFVPSDVYIDRQNFHSDEDLVEFLLQIDNEKYQKYINNIIRFLESKDFSRHYSTALADTIMASIQSNIHK